MLSCQLNVFAYSDNIDSLNRIIATKKDTSKINFIINAANMLESVGNYPQLHTFAKRALNLSHKFSYTKGIADAKYWLGVYEYRIGNYPKALDYYFSALKSAQKINYSKAIADAYHGIGNVYMYQNDLNKSLNYYKKSYDLRKLIGDSLGMAGSLQNMGIIKYENRDFNAALKYYQLSMSISEKIGDKKGIAYSYNNIGTIYTEKGDYKEALKCNIASLKLKKEIGHKHGVIFSLINIGSVYRLSHDFERAKACLDTALYIALNIGEKELIKSTFYELTNLDTAKGDWKSAYAHAHLLGLYRDSLMNEENTKKIAEIEFAKEREISKALQEKRDAIAKETMERQIIITFSVLSVLVLILFFAIFIYNRYKTIRKQKIIIEEQKRVVEDKQKEILDSIQYAKRIQRALLPSERSIQKHLKK